MAISFVDGLVGSLKRKKKGSFKRVQMYQPTIGEDLDIVKQDHVVKTHPANNRNRRTLVLKKENNSWGFTLQSYGIHHKTTSEIEDLTYVDYVELSGPAFMAGLRKGDIILSVNGTTAEDKAHKDLVNIIKNCGDTMRLVVLFEDCSRKVDLHLRYIKLKKLLAAKEFELNSIDEKINRLQNGEKLSTTHRLGSAPSISCTSLQDDRWSLVPKGRSSARTLRPASVCCSNASEHVPGYSSLPRVGSPSKHTDPHAPEPESVVNVGLVHNGSGMKAHSSAAAGDLCTENLDVPKVANSYPDASHDVGGPDQFHSLPIRTKKRPSSLLLPSHADVKLGKPGMNRASSISMQNLNQPTGDKSPSMSTPSPSPTDVPSPGMTFLSRRQCSRSSSRSRSFRSSVRHSMSPALGESYQESSNHVITEENCRLDTEPTLLRLKQGNMDFRTTEVTPKRSQTLTRSASSPHVKSLLSKFEGKAKNAEISLTGARSQCDKPSGDSLRRSQSTSAQVVAHSRMENPRITVSPPPKPSENNVQNILHEAVFAKQTGSQAKASLCSDSNDNCLYANRGSPNSAELFAACDANGNPIIQCAHLTAQSTPQRSRSNENLCKRKPNSANVIGKSRPRSTGSDVKIVSRTASRSSTGSGSSATSRSSANSRSSSASSNGISSPESGTFEFYADPFTPSPDEPINQNTLFSPKLTDTPITNPLKKLSKRILTYSRHKEVIRHEFQLMNINEEEEVTRL